MQILERAEWEPLAAAHAARVDAWIQPHLDRQRRHQADPVHDFMFRYYSQRPAVFRLWHPGYDVGLRDAADHATRKGYRTEDGVTAVAASYLQNQRVLIESIHRLLVATRDRTPTLGCFGLHEWAMVYRTDETRHPVPLRLGGKGTDEVVDSHRIACSHFDAFRFFTDPARPLNTLHPERDNRPDFEQPGCLHASMDLYKHAYRLSPLIPSNLVADCFALAWEVRELDMRASPYDLSGSGYEPVRIETPEGKQQYAAEQREFTERARPLRQRLIDECERLLTLAG